MGDIINHFSDKALEKVEEKYIDRSIYRILYSFIKLGIFDNNNTNSLKSNVTSIEQKKIA